MKARRAGRPSTIPPDPKRVNRVRKLRERAGMSQEKFGELANVTQQYLSKIENGRVPLTIEDARNWAPLLDCSPLDFFTEQQAFTIPVTLAAAAASSPKAPGNEGAPGSYDLPAPHRRLAALPAIADAGACEGVDVLDDHADRLYPPKSVLVRRIVDGRARLRLGQKIVVRRYKRLEGGGRRTAEVLVGLLGLAQGDLVLQLRSTNTDLPASIVVQPHRLPRGLTERVLEGIPAGEFVDYVAGADDPAEIIGAVVLAITPEEV